MSFSLILKIAKATVLSLIMAFVGIFVPVTQNNVCMIAHRGYSGKYHENTALAFEKAYENGSGGAETDVRITSDGVLVLSHNSSVTLSDGTELEVSEHTYQELHAKPLKNKKGKDEVYICTFEEYLDIMKKHGMVCFIELKGKWENDDIKRCFNLCEEKYELSKCILQSFDFDNLLNARSLFPELPIMLTYGEGDGDWSRCLEHGFSIDAEYTTVTPEMVEAFHAQGLEVAMWTANLYAVVSYGRSLGVDYIESDNYGG